MPLPFSLLSFRETADVLDADELASLRMTLTKRPDSAAVQLYTDASYVVSCSDMSSFFHETWSSTVSAEVAAIEGKELGVFSLMSTLANQIRSGLFSTSSASSATVTVMQQSGGTDDELSFMCLTPAKPRKRGESIDYNVSDEIYRERSTM
jgi:hypothetical protein